jgi:hypothetical protein
VAEAGQHGGEEVHETSAAAGEVGERVKAMVGKRRVIN